jgi:cysteine desulfurase/selenocysteine lyase
MLQEERGVVVRYAELTPERTLDLDSLDRQIGPRTRMVAVTAMSNVLGTVVPLEEVGRRARADGAAFLVDAAQGVPHLRLRLDRIRPDFLAFSGHKMCGPTGIGVLWGRRELLEAMPPVVGGGDMVLSVTREGATWNELPYRFEAGTPPIAQAIGLGAAVAYLERLDWPAVLAQQHALLEHAEARLREVEGLELFAPPPAHNGGVLSFTLDRVHPHDLAHLLDHRGVAIRAGQHCAMPLHQTLGLPATARASLYLYNTPEEVDTLADALRAAHELFHRPRKAAAGDRR